MLKDDTLKDKDYYSNRRRKWSGKGYDKIFSSTGSKGCHNIQKSGKTSEAAKELEAETGGTVFCVSCDVRNWDEVEAMKEATLERIRKD